MPSVQDPSALAAVPQKVLTNSAVPQKILPPSQQIATIAVPTDLATSIICQTAILAGLRAVGLMV